MVECALTAIMDRFPSLRPHNIAFKACFCFMMFLFGLPLCTGVRAAENCTVTHLNKARRNSEMCFCIFHTRRWDSTCWCCSTRSARVGRSFSWVLLNALFSARFTGALRFAWNTLFSQTCAQWSGAVHVSAGECCGKLLLQSSFWCALNYCWK